MAILEYNYRGYNNWSKVDSVKRELDNYKKLFSQLEKDNKELNKKILIIKNKTKENKILKKKVKELELRIEKLNKFNRFEIMEI